MLEQILDLIIGALNSNAGMTFLISFCVIIINKVIEAKPKWEKYEGAILSGVLLAQKAIPADTENKGLECARYAFGIVAKAFEEINGRAPNERETAMLKEGINIKHAELLKDPVVKKIT